MLQIIICLTKTRKIKSKLFNVLFINAGMKMIQISINLPGCAAGGVFYPC